MNKIFYLILISLLSSCATDIKDIYKGDLTKPTPEPIVNTYSLNSPNFVFGFIGEHRYSYCPSALRLEDGTVHLYFCGNPNATIMVDNIYHIRINPDGTKTKAKSVLQPGVAGSWDDHHTCDPSVVEGEFKYNGTTYKYAMFFLSNRYNVYYNEVGVAFSNDLESDTWVKYPKQIVTKTWEEDGDQWYSSTGRSWGTGQPSVVSLNKKGKVLLTYTKGDIKGTSVVWSEGDFSDMDNYTLTAPVDVVTSGLKQTNNQTQDYLSNSSFAISPENDKILLMRPVHPHANDYPNYIASVLEIDYMNLSDFKKNSGFWTPLYRLTSNDTGYARNHNCVIQHDTFGHIDDWEQPVFYYTVSKATPDVSPGTTTHAEWTYHIWKSQLIKNKTH